MVDVGSGKKRGAGIVVLVVLLLVTAVRIRLADVPLERDEGEYAYAGQLILEGIPPYRIAYNMKFPGTYYAYAAILALFGQTSRGIHLGLAIVDGATLLLVFLLARRVAGDLAAASAAVAFAVLSIDRWIMGVFAHATHFLVFFAAAGLLLLLRGIARGQTLVLAGAGACLGLAVLMKQHAIFFLAFAVAFAAWNVSAERNGRERKLRRVGAVLAGAALPLVVLLMVLGAQGVLGRFWYWTVRYAAEYASRVSWSEALPALVVGWQLVTQATLPWWIVSALGLVALWATPWPRDTRFLVSGFFVTSFLAICPGFYFREHYFITMVPALALLVGIALASAGRVFMRVLGPTAGRWLPLLALAGLVGHYVLVERHYLFTMTPRELSRTRYGPNPFLEAPMVARHIREHSAAHERIGVLGSEPEIFFHAGRKSATGYIYVYPLVEDQPFASRMQDEMIREIEAALPGYLVLVRVDLSWSLSHGADRRIFDWAQRFIQRCYELEGVADIYSLDETNWAWGAEARSYRPVSENLILVFKRSCPPP